MNTGSPRRNFGEQATSQVVFLIDEIESDLHPRWQRSILGSLLELVSVLHANAHAQIIAATHSALILASASNQNSTPKRTHGSTLTSTRRPTMASDVLNECSCVAATCRGG